MKRFISFVLSLLLVVSLSVSSIAEGDITYADLTDEELHALIDGCRNELAKRELVAAEDVVLFEREGVTLYLTGNNDVDKYTNWLTIGVVVVNDSEHNLSVLIDSASINGWDINALGVSDVTAGKKKKADLTFMSEDADISSVDEVEDIELTIRLWDTDTYENIGEKFTFTIQFSDN